MLNKIYSNQQDQNLLEKLLDVAESHQTNKSVDKSDPRGTSTGDIHARAKLQRQNYGTLDNSKLEYEFFKVKNKTPKEEIIKFENYESIPDANPENKEFESNLLQKFESFSQQKDDGIYAKFKVPNKLMNKDLLYSTQEERYDIASEKFINNQNDAGRKKLLNSSVERMNLKDPYLRYSVNDPGKFEAKSVSKPKKTLLGTKKSHIEPNMGQMYKDTSNYMKKENKLELTLAGLTDERIDIKDFDNDEQFDSFGQINETLNRPTSHFSSFSNNNTTMKKNENNLIDSFGPKPSEITVEILSNWGSPFQIGLSQVKLYDVDMNEIILEDNSIKLYNNNNLQHHNQVHNLINDRVATTSPSDMLILDYNQYKDKYAIVISYPMDADLGFVVLWNLNEDPCKGVRRLRVSTASKKIFEGDIQQATGKLTNYARFLTIKVQPDLDEDMLFELINKRFVSDRLHSPVPKTNLPPLVGSSAQRKVERKNPDTPLFDSSTPKNKLRGKNEILDKTKTPNPLKKSSQTFEKFESVKIPSNVNIDSKNKLKSFHIVEAHSDIKPFKPQYVKLEPIAISRPKNVFESCNSLTDLAQVYGTSKIPTLPLVDGLTCKLLSNWDDKTSIGLNGFEVFNEMGEKLQLTHKNVFLQSKNGKSFPKMNEERLVSDSLNTTDENKHWSYPIKNNMPLILRFKFDTPQQISLIRIWNYNCSRIHAAKGVKDIVITNYEDNSLLFAGRMRKASGLLTKPRKNFESILFTFDKGIINSISKNDWLYSSLSKKSNTVVKRKIKNCFDEFINQRPTTAELEELQSSRQKAMAVKLKEHMGSQSNEFKQKVAFPSNNVLDIQGVIGCKTFKIEVLETWGHQSEFGLIGIEFYTSKNQKVPEEYYTVSSKSKIMGDESAGLDVDLKSKRSLYLRFKPNEENIIEFTFKSFLQMSYLCIYNLGETSKNSTKGLKRLALHADNNLLTNETGIYIKRGSCLEFMKKYPQKITFPISQLVYNIDPKPSSLMPISSPTGFTIEFHLKCTFGDPYYIGLNGIEIFDIMGNNLLTKENEMNFRLIADPPGVFMLPSMSKDPRTVSNLYKPNPFIDNVDNVWLAPFAKYDKTCKHNIIVVEFKNPVTIGVINVWNYSRTANRGVKEVEVYLDDNLVYCGWLNDINERLISSIIFNEAFLKRRVDHIKIEPISYLPREITELHNEGTLLSKRRSEKYLGDSRPATGLHLP